jgi:hypothetical protein
VDVDRATRVARVTERIGADLVLNPATSQVCLQRVQEGGLRDLSRSSLAATSRELRLERARINGAAAKHMFGESATTAGANPAETRSRTRSRHAGASDGTPPPRPTP